MNWNEIFLLVKAGLSYKYSPPSDNEDTNGNIRVYRLIDAPANPAE